MRRLLAFAMLLAGGCASQTPYGPGAYNPDVLRHETFTVNSPQVVLGTPSPGGPDLAAAWWLDRNDARLNVRSGQTTGEVVSYVVHTEDRQRSFGQRQHDIHRREVYTTRSGQLVR